MGRVFVLLRNEVGELAGDFEDKIFGKWRKCNGAAQQADTR